MFPPARRIAPIQIPAANIKFQIFIHKQNSEKNRTFPRVSISLTSPSTVTSGEFVLIFT